MSTPSERWERQLRDTASALRYPPTPDIASAVARRLQAGARPSRDRPLLRGLAIAALLLVLAALAAPPVRAALAEILRIGAIRIVPAAPTPILPPPTAEPAGSRAASPTPAPAPATPTPLASVLDLAGETTLAAAQAQAGFPIRLPEYPADLGTPDRVFLQDLGGPLVVLVWLDPADASKVRLSLHEFGPNTFAEKLAPRVVRETQVNGAPALWARGPHLLQTQSRPQEYTQRRLVNGHVLIWTAGDITYRLENDLSEAEAIRIAESLR